MTRREFAAFSGLGLRAALFAALMLCGCADLLGFRRATVDRWDADVTASAELGVQEGGVATIGVVSDGAVLDGAVNSDAMGPDAATLHATDAEEVPSCERYCETLMQACDSDADKTYAVYDSSLSCLAQCAVFAPGVAGDQSGNSLACRFSHAELALAFPGERQFECPAAGPGGDGVCGSNCESYCMLMAAICPEQDQGPNCLDACSSVPDLGGFDVSEIEGNSLQCRFYHLGVATVSARLHCVHASGERPCADP
ncbi:MAG TPA: hypothetical protein VHM70_30290 [Polyangiaceae bacterium]|nr:hypothetical protein [Polyangiaceae bacterium]